MTRARKLTLAQAALLLAGTITAAVAVWWSWHGGETASSRIHFSQFWTLPQSNRRVEVGVTNREGRQLAYSLTIRANNVWLLKRRVAISPGGTWTTMLNVPLDFKPVSVVGHLAAPTGSRSTHVVISP